MLNEAELDALLDKHGLDAPARAQVRAIRKADPSRRVESGPRNVSCRYPSKKMGQVIQAESHTCELAAIVLWEHDERIYEFYDQCPPIGLKAKDKTGRNRGYHMTPDFFVIGEDYIGWVECKAQTWLESKAQKSTVYAQSQETWQCVPGQEYAEQYGLGFKVLVDTAINQILVRNMNFLSDFLDAACAPVAQEIEARIIEAFGGKAFVPLADLLKIGDSELISSVYKLIAEEKLYANLDSELLVDVQFVNVYRDRRTAESFRLARSELAVSRNKELIQSIVIEPGQGLLWDGQPWTIVNVGGDKIAIKDEAGAIQTLSRGQLLLLVKSGNVQGTSSDSLSREDEIGRMIAEASNTDLQEADGRLKELGRIQAGEKPTVCERTVRYWKARMRESNDLLGSTYVGLISRYQECGNRTRRIPLAVQEKIQHVIQEFLLGDSPKSKQSCYAILCTLCHQESLVPPSRKTFGKEIKRTTSEHAQVLARYGEKAAYALSEIVHWQLDNAVPPHGDRAFEIAHVDHTQMDVQLIHSVYGTPMGKPWLTILIDAYTRMVLAYVISYEKPSYRSCMLVIRECLRRHRRVPANIVCDKGSEFFSLYWETLLARLHVTKKTRPTAKGRFGSVIERFFGKANVELLHQLKGNNTPLQAPRSMSGSHDPRKKAVWTLAELTSEFDEYLENTYSHLTHPALGVSPKMAEETSLRNSGARSVRMLNWSPSLALLCLPEVKGGDRKIVANRGISLNRTFYYHPMLNEPALANTKVSVRYDPFDYGLVYAKVGKEWLPCSCPEAAQLTGRTEKEVRLLTYELRFHQNSSAADRKNYILRGEQLLSTELKEKVLTQQKHDMEKQVADRRMGKMEQCPQDIGKTAIGFDTAFEINEDDIETYGEFK